MFIALNPITGGIGRTIGLHSGKNMTDIRSKLVIGTKSIQCQMIIVKKKYMIYLL